MAKIPYPEARDLLLSRCTPNASVSVHCEDAFGLVLAEDIVADEPVPGFDNSAMDGWAVRAEDAVAGARLRIVGSVAAGGSSRVEVGAGEAVRILTGAPMPRGADAVVAQERAHRLDDDGLVIDEGVARGRHVRPTGDDLAIGTVVASAGDAFTLGAASVAAALGLRRVSVRRRPRVAILATGDEVVEAGPGDLRHGQVRNSNQTMLTHLVRGAGAIPLPMTVAADEREDLAARLRVAARDADLILTTGGASVGDRDLMASVLDGLADGEATAVRTNLRPGKPMVIGSLRGTPVLGLPGNPVAALVVAVLVGLPALRRLAGERQPLRPRLAVRLATDIDDAPVGRATIRFATVSAASDGLLVAHIAEGQRSHRLGTIVGATALVEIHAPARAGAIVPAVLIPGAELPIEGWA